MPILLPLFGCLVAINIEVVAHFSEFTEVGDGVLFVAEDYEVFDDGFQQFYSVKEWVKDDVGVIHGI